MRGSLILSGSCSRSPAEPAVKGLLQDGGSVPGGGLSWLQQAALGASSAVCQISLPPLEFLVQ